MSEFRRRCKISPKLTESQRNAVFAICENEHNEFPFVLFGPPGTGKTFTISQAIQGILRKDKNNRVLVCTMSNMAANRVAEQLMADFGDVLNEQNVLRLRATSNDYYQRDRQFEKIYS
jgi:superfamily I DNA/RNA helicase